MNHVSCSKELFGTMPDGTDVYRYTLYNGCIRCCVITYGGIITALEVPDRNGDPVDVTLGYDTLEDYFEQDKYIGALIGRYANRIGNSRFALDGKEYPLYANEGKNHLHGGKVGFDKKVWNAQQSPNGLLLSLSSPHMEEGYPGNLNVQVEYSLTNSTFAIHYRATSDAETILNLTHHAYFNLGGHSSGSIREHYMRLFASYYTPVADKQAIPTGEIAPVEGTPMDFRKGTRIGKRIDDAFDQLKYGSGYDHNWVVDGVAGTLRPAAEACCPDTGIVMQVETTSPCIQLYTGNYLDDGPLGKGGACYRKQEAFCLETQFCPDAPNHPEFAAPTLRPGEKWEHTTVFRFKV